MSEIPSVRRLLGLLPAIVVLSASTLIPQPAWGQMVSGAEPPAPFVNTPFDDVTDRLGAAADRLLATPIPRPATQNVGSSGATQDKAASTPNAITTAPERHNKADMRVAQLRPVIDPILRREGVPPELAAVALIESGGQPDALSPKGARGLWQLMPDTARRYGLIVSGQRDERLDLVAATQAAARYLHDLHAQFGDWELALAAYNAGEQAVNAAIVRAKNHSFAVLSELHLLPAETRNYVPAVIFASGGSLKQLPSKEVSSSPRLPSGAVFFALIAPNQPIAVNPGERSSTAHP